LILYFSINGDISSIPFIEKYGYTELLEKIITHHIMPTLFITLFKIRISLADDENNYQLKNFIVTFYN